MGPRESCGRGVQVGIFALGLRSRAALHADLGVLTPQSLTLDQLVVVRIHVPEP